MSAPPDPPPERDPPVGASPLWGLLLVLAEIAERVVRDLAEVQAGQATETPQDEEAA
jgi:hypothetical protein